MTLIAPRENIQYLPHQESGIRWMLEREKYGFGILADDMGLGKTFQIIGLLKNSPNQCKTPMKNLTCPFRCAYRTLILCPIALLDAWAKELRACGFRPRMMTPSSTPLFAGKDSDADIWLTSYSKALYYPNTLSEMRFDRIILDEGHAIRNRGKLWEACVKIAEHSLVRWIISATPVQNGSKDWRNLLSWGRASPSDPMDRESDREEPILLRRTMNELRASTDIKLPPSATFIYHDLEVPGGKEGKIFSYLCNGLVESLDQSKVNIFLVLEMYLRLQQFIVHPQIYINAMRRKYESYAQPDWSDTTTKWSQFVNVLEASEEPTIVFCYFREEMDMVRDKVVAMGRSAFSIRGGMSAKEIGETVQKGRDSPNATFIVQIVSGGCGLNLQFCKRILFLSLHWNPAVVHQAVGRAVRVGQDISVPVHIFRITDPNISNVDRRMHELHGEKIFAARDICDSFFDSFGVA